MWQMSKGHHNPVVFNRQDRAKDYWLSLPKPMIIEGRKQRKNPDI